MRHMILAAVLFYAAMSGLAHAGNVHLSSNTWDFICHVDTIGGLDAPQFGSTRSFSNVARGQDLGTYTDKVCYRRSNDASQCNSGISAWNCCQQLVTGTYECDVQ
jgi:hypothetical protein